MGSQRVVRRHHYFYGFEHQYGAGVAGPGGGDLGRCYVFWSRADRDAWVRKARTDDHNAPGYREAYPASKARGWDIYTAEEREKEEQQWQRQPNARHDSTR